MSPCSSSAPAADEQAPQPPTPVNHSDYESKKDDNDSDGVFGPFRIGVLVGGGLPEILSLGGQIKLTRFFGAGINVGLIPTVKISYYGDAQLSYQEYDAYGRLYPFGGAFFLGAGVGYATIRGSLANRFNTSSYTQSHPEILAAYPGFPSVVDVNSDARVRTLVLTPQIGFMKIFGSGFTIGVDVGAQIPIAPSKVDFDTTTPSLGEPLSSIVQSTYITPNDQKVRSTLDKIGRTPVPTFNLKIGWFL